MASAPSVTESSKSLAVIQVSLQDRPDSLHLEGHMGSGSPPFHFMKHSSSLKEEELLPQKNCGYRTSAVSMEGIERLKKPS